jgi:hypothetical protein
LKLSIAWRSVLEAAAEIKPAGGNRPQTRGRARP